MRLLSRVMIAILLAGVAYGSDAVVGGRPDRYVPLTESPTATGLSQQSRDISMNVILRNSAVAHGETVLSADQTTSRAAALRRHPRSLLPQATIITSCSDITAPGTYVLTADLTSDQASCLNVSSTHDVVLNCAGHSFTSLRGKPTIVIDGTNNFSMSNCTFHNNKQNVYGPAIQYVDVVAQYSSGIHLSSNTFNSVQEINVTQSSVMNNAFHGSLVLRASTKAVVSNNTFVVDHDPTENAAIYSHLGSSNTFTNNTINGRWDGQAASYEKVGTDCAIDIGYESYDVATNNTIANFWNAGIEAYGLVTNTLIADNRISNILGPMVSSFWNTSWTNNTVRGNQGTNAASIWDVQTWDNENLRFGTKPAQTFFLNNTFENNGLKSQGTPTNRYPTVATIALFVDAPALVASNNLIKNNNFGPSRFGPELEPPSAFIDGGGNTCGLAWSNSPIVCH